MLRPLPWLVLALVSSGLLLLADALTQRDQERAFARPLRLTAQVGAGYGRGGDVPLRYWNPETAQEISTRTSVWRVRRPRAGQNVRIEVNRDDPGDVVLAGDRYTVLQNLPITLLWPGLTVAAIALRLFGAIRSRRLLESEETIFSMLGALTPPWRFGRLPLLHLYAVDALPGDAPVCSLPVVSTTGHPVPSGAFPVLVRGFPRPGGRVVATAGPDGGDESDRTSRRVLWPASRALLSSKARLPAAAEPAAKFALHAVDRPSFGSSRRAAIARLVGPEAVGVAASVLLLIGSSTLTLTNAARAEQVRRRAERVIAEVVAASDSEPFVLVSFVDPATGATRRARAPAQYPKDHPIGRRYPALVAGDDVRLAREPYDAEKALGWAAAPLVVTALLLGRRVWQLLESRRALRTGPYHIAALCPLAAGGRWRMVGIGAPGHAPCVVVKLGGPPLETCEVIVAGDAEPGAPIALILDGRSLLALGPGSTPPPSPT